MANKNVNKEDLSNSISLNDNIVQFTYQGQSTPYGENSSELFSAMPVVTELSHLAVVDVVGDDAEDFLHAQVCNDLKSLDSLGVAQLNGYCSPKGRLLAFFTVYRIDGGFRLLLTQSVVEAFTKRLRMFVLRAKVEVTVRQDLFCRGLTLNHHDQRQLLGGKWAGVELPQARLQVTSVEHLQLIQWHSVPPLSDHAQAQTLPEPLRLLCVASEDQWAQMGLEQNVIRTNAAYWRHGDILSGVATIVTQTADQFIPQMVNAIGLEALSFKKGCYPGQEIVARMQYLGKLKRQMKLFVVPHATTALSAGDVLSTPTDSDAGKVVDYVQMGGEGFCLAVLKVAVPVDQLSADGALLGAHLLALPYESSASEETQA